MRTKVFLLVFLFASLLAREAEAQYQFISEPNYKLYDTLYVFDTTYMVSCFHSLDTTRIDFWWDDIHREISIPYSRPFADFAWYSALKARVCDSTVPVPQGNVIGSNNYNGTQYAEAFAQHYDLDSMPVNYVVCGVAIKLGWSALDDFRKLSILDNNFDTIATTYFHTVNVSNQFTGETFPWNRGGWNLYYFRESSYEALTNINDFHIAFDVPLYGSGNTFRVGHTCNIDNACIYEWIQSQGGPFAAGYNYDSIRTFFLDRHSSLYRTFRDTVNNTWPYTDSPGWQTLRANIPDTVIPLCSYPDPKYIKHEGEWVNFLDDPVYEIYRNIYILMVPIIMVPKTEQSLSEAELSAICYLYPNPAKSSFKVLSHYNIESVQVFDISGRLLKEQKLRYFEGQIDIGDLPSGTYIVKIHTSKGTAEKKLIKD